MHENLCSSPEPLVPDLAHWDRVLLAVGGKECHIPAPHMYPAAANLDIHPCPHADVDQSRFFTWRPRDSIFLSLCRDDSFGTILHLYETDQSYFAPPACMLPVTVPSGTVVLGQYVEDVDPATRAVHPRVLLFDIPVLAHRDMQQVPARDRYAALRSSISDDAMAKSQSLLRVQWVGEYSCSSMITENKMRLPHPVQSLLVLRDDQVCVLDCVKAAGREKGK